MTPNAAVWQLEVVSTAGLIVAIGIGLFNAGILLYAWYKERV